MAKNEAAAELWQRVQALIEERYGPKKVRFFSQKVFDNPTFIGASIAASAMPGAAKLRMIADALGVTMSDLLPGSEPDASQVDVTLTTAAQKLTLDRFLNLLRSKGLLGWSESEEGDGLTMADAVKAVWVLQDPQYSTSGGEPPQGWKTWLEEQRANGFKRPSASPKPQKTKAIAEALDGGELEHGELTIEAPVKKNSASRNKLVR